MNKAREGKGIWGSSPRNEKEKNKYHILMHTGRV